MRRRLTGSFAESAKGEPPALNLKAQAWWTVKRQGMTADAFPTAGVYFGTTSGEVWGSRDEGRTWKCLVAHLPHIYAVEAV